jgi:ubiquinone/menaquinone biosynthesis C-methylase UbiE
MLKWLQCPVSGEALHQEADMLVSQSGRHCYPISPSGIPLFVDAAYVSPEALVQQQHYDAIAGIYVDNLSYPHTQEYMRYLDDALLQQTAGTTFKRVAEICCGRGEAFLLYGDKTGFGLGVDVSQAMLEAAREHFQDERFSFVQGDATVLPVQSGQFDTVLMLGGIHHVNNRERLFAEVFRILKPGGRFYWREPVSDFFLWQLLRAIAYRLSPALDANTEHPLKYRSTRDALHQAGFRLTLWQTYGFIGFMLFMNSDVLVFNRLFRFIPGIRAITRLFARLDDWFLHLPGMKNRGLQVIGGAEKPEASA